LVEASVHHKTAILKLRELLHQLYIPCATLAVLVRLCAVMQLKGHFWLLYMLLHTFQSYGKMEGYFAAVAVTVKAAMVQVRCSFHQQ